MNRIKNFLVVACICGTLFGCNATAQRGGLDGLYFMTRFSTFAGLETSTYLFHDGTVVRNPIGGGRTPDVAAERAVHPDDVGSYKLAGGQLTFTFSGSPHTAKYETMKGGFGWDAGIFSPVEIFKSGATLDGTFTGGNSVGVTSGSTAGTSLIASTDIVFHRDGSYQSGTVTSVSSRNSTSQVSGGGQSGESGRYHIDGTSMHMTPNGGKEVVFTCFPWDDGTAGPTPRAVYLRGTMMTRAK